MTKIVDVINW